MYAVVESGGKQYRVSEGEIVAVERLRAEPGEEIRFERVLAVGGDGSLRPGNPLVADAHVTGRVLDEVRGRKVVAFRYKAKANERRKHGHRQALTRVLVTGVRLGEQAPAVGEPEVAEETEGKDGGT